MRIHVMRTLGSLICLISTSVFAFLDFTPQDQEFLPPEQAFPVDLYLKGESQAEATWTVAPNYYLYRDKISVSMKGTTAQHHISPPLPPGQNITDEHFGSVQILRGKFQTNFELPLWADEVTVRYQGCADAGLCYPVITKTWEVPELATRLSDSVIANQPPPPTSSPLIDWKDNMFAIADFIHQAHWGWMAVVFFGLGLLLAATPCVLPMFPIVATVVTQGMKKNPVLGPSRKSYLTHALALSSIYVLAMALTYSLLGLAFAFFGNNIQTTFQQPPIIAGVVTIFVILALSMFGLYELQLPISWQKLITKKTQGFGSGTVNAAIMGTGSAIIVSPCVTPPLLGALLFVGQSGDGWTGAVAMGSLGLGMGFPLILFATSLGGIFPKLKGGMQTCKEIFGFVLLGVAIWILDRVILNQATLLLTGILCICFGVYLLFMLKKFEKFSLSVYIAVLVLCLWGGLYIAQASVGGTRWLTPWNFQTLTTKNNHDKQDWPELHSAQEVNTFLHRARSQSSLAMLIYRADWCISCRELEADIFPNPKVANLLKNFHIAYVDVTKDNESTTELLRIYGLFGPPVLLFFKTSGKEEKNFRVVGFISSEQLIKRLRWFVGKHIRTT